MPVYMIQAGTNGPVKIGFTSHLQRRLSKLQADNPAPLCVLRWLRGTKETEASLHRAFAPGRIRGDWHHFCPQMLTVAADDEIPRGQRTRLGNLKPHALTAWLEREGIGPEAFAGLIKVRASSVYRYVAGERLPRREIMVRIEEVTGGAVQPNDFFASSNEAA